MATLNISMPDSMREWIDDQVRSGEYANASDYIRDLIRHDRRERHELRLLLLEGERSGTSEHSVIDIAKRERRKRKGA